MNLAAKRMIFFTLVISYLLYTAFVYTKGTETEKPITGDAITGRQLFREKNCIACHQLYGLGGYMGPDLTNVISEKGESYTRAFLENGTEKMPDFELEKDEINSLITYLTFVDTTSCYPVRNFEITWYGTVKNNHIRK